MAEELTEKRIYYATPVTPTELSPECKPWERQPGESDSDWHRFVIYRNMDPSVRSKRAAYAVSRGLPNTPESRRKMEPGNYFWAATKQWRWEERVRAYDQHVDNMILERLEGRRMRARLETADLGQAMRQKAAEALQELRAVITETKVIDGKTIKATRVALTPAQIARIAEIGVKLERLALGEDIGEVSMPQSLTFIDARQVHITDEELVQRAKDVIEARARDVVPIDQL